jgi:hypothetical protein
LIFNRQIIVEFRSKNSKAGNVAWNFKYEIARKSSLMPYFYWHSRPYVEYILMKKPYIINILKNNDSLNSPEKTP